jgi:hypothetical protein
MAAGKIVVPHPVTGAPFSCCWSVGVVPCPQCRAPVGVPCRGARWRAAVERGPGHGRTKWWWADSHFTRRDLARGVLKGNVQATLQLHEVMRGATMGPVDHMGWPVDVSEEDFPESS